MSQQTHNTCHNTSRYVHCVYATAYIQCIRILCTEGREEPLVYCYKKRNTTTGVPGLRPLEADALWIRNYGTGQAAGYLGKVRSTF